MIRPVPGGCLGIDLPLLHPGTEMASAAGFDQNHFDLEWNQALPLPEAHLLHFLQFQHGFFELGLVETGFGSAIQYLHPLPLLRQLLHFFHLDLPDHH